MQFLSLTSNLQGKFDVKEFVAGISERLISQSKASSGRAYVVTETLYVSHLLTQNISSF